MASPSPMQEGMWRHPDDESALGYRTIDYWTRLAQKLDRSCIDALFFADYHCAWDIYRSSWEPAVRHGASSPSIDPLLLIPALAAVTSGLGFAVTYSTSYHPPYQCARLFSSLDHLTSGRIGWNVVTSHLRASELNGLGAFVAHDERYDRADEYMEVVRRLWEESWSDHAVVLDRANDVFADPSEVREIGFSGNWHEVRGPHSCEPSPQRTPVIYQAGSSPRGTRFAARHSEVVFVSLPDLIHGADQVAELRRQVASAGRDPATLRVLHGTDVVLGRTPAELASKAAMFEEFSSREGQLVRWCLWSDVDLGRHDDEVPIAELSGEGTRTLRTVLERLDPDRAWSIGDVRAVVSRARRPASQTPRMLFGTPAQVADCMEQWLETTGIDGFNLIPGPTSRGVDDICELLVPELQWRGLFRTAYDPSERTLRERYLGAGRLHHPTPLVSARS